MVIPRDPEELDVRLVFGVVERIEDV